MDRLHLFYFALTIGFSTTAEAFFFDGEGSVDEKSVGYYRLDDTYTSCWGDSYYCGSNNLKYSDENVFRHIITSSILINRNSRRRTKLDFSTRY